MNIEQACKDAVVLVQSYLDGDLIAADMMDELCEAQEAVDYAWDESSSRKADRMCRPAWHACIAAKNDERDIAKMYVNAFWEQVK